MKRLLLLTTVLFLCAGSAFAYDGLDLYGANLSARDRVNSKGQPLHSLREILRQDRANYHRFGKRDPEDQGDSLFRSAENRALFDTATIRADPALQKAILSGRVTVVTVFILSRNLIDVVQGLPTPGVD